MTEADGINGRLSPERMTDDWAAAASNSSKTCTGA